MIRFANVSFRYANRQVLSNFTMDVPPGQTRVILGGSGGGKTTTLRLVLGLLKPESGSILVDGQEIVHFTEQQMVPIRAKMAMVFQGSALFDSLTVAENVGYRLWEEGVLEEEAIEQAVDESLRFVGLEDITHKMPAELSGGMKKRVAIARALACRPKIILYDEPTAGLDPTNTYLINQMICRLHSEEQITQVVVTHDLETAYRVADRLVMIQQGEKIFDGTPDELEAAKDPQIRSFLHPSAVLPTARCFPYKGGAVRVVETAGDSASPFPT